MKDKSGYSFIILNVFILSLFMLGYFEGWISIALSEDTFHLVKFITGFFLIGWFLCLYKLIQLRLEVSNLSIKVISGFSLDYLPIVLKNKQADKNIVGAAFSNKVFSYISIVRKFSNLLVLLGLLGTVFGVIYAFAGFNIANITDVSALGPASVSLFTGFKIALYTTLAGTIYSFWLTLCYHILENYTIKYIGYILQYGEKHENI